MKATSIATKVSISHLLLNQHFLNRDAAIINRINLARDRSSLIATSDRTVAR